MHSLFIGASILELICVFCFKLQSYVATFFWGFLSACQRVFMFLMLRFGSFLAILNTFLMLRFGSSLALLNMFLVLRFESFLAFFNTLMNALKVIGQVRERFKNGMEHEPKEFLVLNQNSSWLFDWPQRREKNVSASLRSPINKTGSTISTWLMSNSPFRCSPIQHHSTHLPKNQGSISNSLLSCSVCKFVLTFPRCVWKNLTDRRQACRNVLHTFWTGPKLTTPGWVLGFCSGSVQLRHVYARWGHWHCDSNRVVQVGLCSCVASKEHMFSSVHERYCPPPHPTPPHPTPPHPTPPEMS